MEKYLLDMMMKADNTDDVDDVSKAMIVSRVVNALKQVRELTNQYIKNLQALSNEYADELKLGGLAVVLNVTTDILAECKQACVLGNSDNVMKNIANIKEMADGE